MLGGAVNAPSPRRYLVVAAAAGTKPLFPSAIAEEYCIFVELKALLPKPEVKV